MGVVAVFNGRRRIIFFSLLEMTLALGVFLILMTVMLRFYSSAFSMTSKVSRKNMVFENARIAMDIITRDLQSIYYRNEVIPFWHWKPDSKPAPWKEYRNELLAFISATSLLPNKDCKSNLCEVKYQLYYSTNKKNSYNGWLRRSVTGDRLTSAPDIIHVKWNFYYNHNVGYKTDISSKSSSAFTANSSSVENYQKVIPYVTELSFICYDRDGNSIEADKNINEAEDAGKTTDFPYSIEITLKLMDKDSWAKWLGLFSDGGVYPKIEPVSARTFRKNNERKFTKTIFIGDRGQYG